MDYKHSTIEQLNEAICTGKVKSEELFNEAMHLIEQYQEDYNAFVTIISKYKKYGQKDTLISGIPYALKDNISTSGILTTASSNILKDYIPVYDATIYKKLKQAGAVLVGKTTLDELAMGGTGTTAHTGIVRNPYDKQRLIGGSSAGSAAAVSLGIVPFAIGSDTGDSIRKPASFGGIVGFKPTYGRISRYGLFAFASSLDHIGCFTRNVRDAAIVTDILKGNDPNDMTTLPDEEVCYLDHLNDDIKGRKLFYIKEICEEKIYQDSDENVKKTIETFHQTVEKLKEAGFEVDEVSINKELLNAIYPTYMIISCAEATSNNANLTGIQFGPRQDGQDINEIMFRARTIGFSELIKRRFVLGSYILQKENQEKLFKNACRVRRMIVDKMNDLFKEYDGLVLPASGTIAPEFTHTSKSEKLDPKATVLENHMAIANFGGFPSITLPMYYYKGLPVGINLTGRPREDKDVLNMAQKIEDVLQIKNKVAGDYDV